MPRLRSGHTISDGLPPSLPTVVVGSDQGSDTMTMFEVGRELPVGGAPRLFVRAESWAEAVSDYAQLCHESGGMFDSQLGVDLAAEQEPVLEEDDMVLQRDRDGLLRVVTGAGVVMTAAGELM